MRRVEPCWYDIDGIDCSSLFGLGNKSVVLGICGNSFKSCSELNSIILYEALETTKLMALDLFRASAGIGKYNRTLSA
jgi:hypothetical protein